MNCFCFSHGGAKYAETARPNARKGAEAIAAALEPQPLVKPGPSPREGTAKTDSAVDGSLSPEHLTTITPNPENNGRSTSLRDAEASSQVGVQPWGKVKVIGGSHAFSAFPGYRMYGSTPA